MTRKTQPHRNTALCTVLLAALTMGAPSKSFALPFPDWWFVEVGRGELGGTLAATGVGWHLPWHFSTAAGKVETRLEAHLGHWSVTSGSADGWRSYQVTVLPLVRHTWRTDVVPVFVEGGIGASYFQQDLRTSAKEMGTRWNFYDTLAIGVQLGPRRQHELSLRVVHQSNAGIRKPNPGINSAQIRLAVAF